MLTYFIFYLRDVWRHSCHSSPVSIQTHAMHASHATQNAIACVRCVRCINENRKKRKLKQPIMVATASIEHILLAGACVWCVKNRIGSIVAFSYAMTDCVSCATCACIFLFFDCVIFLHLLRFLRTFYFACVFFLRKILGALRAFEWKPGFIHVHVYSHSYSIVRICERVMS